MSLRDNEFARREDGKLDFRPGPLRVQWTLNDILTRDGHDLHVTFSASAAIVADPAEQRMFEEVLLGRNYRVTDDELAARFQPALHAATARLAQLHTAAEWVGGTFDNELADALRAAAKSVAFGCGVEVLAPFEVSVQSPSFQKQQLRTTQQALAEQQSAGRIEHVQRAAELLKTFDSIRAAAPNLAPGRVLEQISPADRGAVLQTLLLASADQQRPKPLWAVAGPYLVRIDLEEAAPRPQLFPLPPTLGPLRSIASAQVRGKTVLLAGARSGVLLIDPSHPQDPQIFRDAAADSPLGFNTIVAWGAKGFAASHGDAGVVLWDPNQGAELVAALRAERFLKAAALPASDSSSVHTAGPRNLCALDDRFLVFSAAEKLFVTDLETVDAVPTQSPSPITAILPGEGRLIVVHEDGTLCALDPGTRELQCISHRAMRVRSAGLLPWLGSPRLLLAGDDGPVNCIGLDDPLLTEYQSPHRGLRAVAGSTGAVAAISADRQRLILWRSWEGRQPQTELYLTGLTRHRVADIAFG